VWRTITGIEKDRPPNLDMKRGLDNEENAISALEAHLGKLVDPGRFVPHPTLEWLGASPDGFIGEIIVEVKCPRVVHGVVPQKYYDQIQTQLECCNAPFAYFVSWTDRNEPFITVVNRDEKWWTESYPVLKEFYELYIETDTEPPRSRTRRKKNAKV
jgi:hypothetical protein